jgi:hypothetical protein
VLAGRHPLGSGYALMRADDGYLRIEEHGNPESPEDVTAYFAAIDRELLAHARSALLIIAAKTGADPSSPHWIAVREARWKALAACRAKRIAVLVDDELAVVRVRMSAVAARANVRAFVLETDAEAWLRAAGRSIAP